MKEEKYNRKIITSQKSEEILRKAQEEKIKLTEAIDHFEEITKHYSHISRRWLMGFFIIFYLNIAVLVASIAVKPIKFDVSVVEQLNWQ